MSANDTTRSGAIAPSLHAIIPPAPTHLHSQVFFFLHFVFIELNSVLYRNRHILTYRKKKQKKKKKGKKIFDQVLSL